MTTHDDLPIPAKPRGFRRVAPALVLFFVAPYVAEFLLGNLSVSVIAALLFLAPLYGGGALAVREIARRLNRGWPTIVLLALAYGLFEEGIVIQTLFNPNYLGLHLLKEAYMPALGIGGWWTPFVLTLHTVWSISVPIAVVEGLFAERRTTPWLGKIGLSVSILLLVVGGILVRKMTMKQDPFAASTTQLVVTSIFLVVVAVLAVRLRPRESARVGGAPATWVVGVVTFALGLAFMSAHAVLHEWTVVGAYGALYLIAIALLITWSRRSGWTPRHTLAAGAGAMLTYACTAFPQEPVVGAKGSVDLIGNTLFAAMAVTLLVLAFRTERRLARG
jgi:hypothetical protein